MLPRPLVMSFALRVMGNLSDGRDGDAQDRLFYRAGTGREGAFMTVEVGCRPC